MIVSFSYLVSFSSLIYKLEHDQLFRASYATGWDARLFAGIHGGLTCFTLGNGGKLLFYLSNQSLVMNHRVLGGMNAHVA